MSGRYSRKKNRVYTAEDFYRRLSIKIERILSDHYGTPASVVRDLNTLMDLKERRKLQYVNERSTQELAGSLGALSHRALEYARHLHQPRPHDRFQQITVRRLGGGDSAQ
jgi:hypothetical protein